MSTGLYFFVGTTAELIKVLPVMKECDRRKLPYKIILSGQNDVLSSGLLSTLGRSDGDIVLFRGQIRQSVGPFLMWFVRTFFASIPLFRKEFKNRQGPKPILVVHGDTVSTVLGALLGRCFGLRVAHLEAGLRSFNYLHPFPEELDRLVVSRLADMHFCPNEWAVENVAKRAGDKINTHHNTLLDSLQLAQNLNAGTASANHFPDGQRYFVLVVHRQENLFNTSFLNSVLERATAISREIPCAFIMHELTKVTLEKGPWLDRLKGLPNIKLIPRLPYFEFMRLLARAEFIVTDGGSNQEESYYLGKPCLILREVTERTEGLSENVLLMKNDFTVLDGFLANPLRYRTEPVAPDRSPSQIIVDHLERA